MNKISISKCVNGAWDLTTKHWVMCIVILVIYVLSSLLSGTSITNVNVYPDMSFEQIMEAYSQSISVNPFRFIIGFIVQYSLMAGLYKMAINAYNGMKVDTSAYKMPLITYAKFIGGYLVYCIIVSIGTLVCILPGIFLGIRLMFVPYILLDEPETEFIEAFKKSWAMTSGHFWSLFGLCIVAFLIYIVGLICCCIGIIFTYIIALFMITIAYYELKNEGSATENSIN